MHPRTRRLIVRLNRNGRVDRINRLLDKRWARWTLIAVITWAMLAIVGGIANLIGALT